jgi:hypothetical protein
MQLNIQFCVSVPPLLKIVIFQKYVIMIWQCNQKHVKIYKHVSYVYNAIIFVYILMFSNLGGI